VVGGAALSAAVTLPVTRALDGRWDLGLALWAVPSAIALLAWVPMARRAPSQQARRIRPVQGLWRDRLAWSITLLMGLQSAMAYSLMGWLSPILRDRGLDGTDAGLATALSILTQVFACLMVPTIAARCRDQRGLALCLSAMATLPLIGMLHGPLWILWPLAAIQGLGQGGLLALALMLIVLRSGDANIAAHLSSMAQTLGYVLAAGGPLVVGLLHDWTGQFGLVTTGVLIALGTACAVTGWLAGRKALVQATVIPDEPAAAAVQPS
jgi:CP family cyanate transporter-like MFS transporter